MYDVALETLGILLLTNGIVSQPLLVPELKVLGGQSSDNSKSVTVTNGQNIEVQCGIGGEAPLVAKLSITFFGTTIVESEGARVPMTVKKEMDKKSCTCQAEYATGYKRNTSILFFVQYSPTVEHFYIEGESLSLVVSDGDEVHFGCTAVANPLPHVTVRGRRSMESVSLQPFLTGDYRKTSSGMKSMSCNDTDIYSCKADNGVGTGSERNVSVMVKCGLRFSTGKVSVTNHFSMNDGTDFKTTVDTVGYPQPANYSLTRVDSNITSLRRDAYRITYNPVSLNEGTVVLRIHDFHCNASGQYILTMMNGIGDGLHYVFNLTVNQCVNNEDSTGLGTMQIMGIIAAFVPIVGIIVPVWIRRKTHTKDKKLQKRDDIKLQNEPMITETV